MNNPAKQPPLADLFLGGNPNNKIDPQVLSYSNLYGDRRISYQVPGTQIFNNVRMGYDPNPKSLQAGMETFGSQVDASRRTTQLPLGQSEISSGDPQAGMKAGLYSGGMNTSRIGGPPPRRA